MHRQSGFMALLLVSLIAIVSMAVLGAFAARLGLDGAQATTQRDQDYVNRAAAAIQSWYAAHPVQMDAGAQPSVPGCSGPVGLCLLTAAGMSPRHGVVVSVGAQQTAPGGNYAWRTITVWIPKSNVTGSARTNYAPANARVVSAFSGRPIERAFWVSANETLNRLSASWTAAYSAWLSNTGNAGNNWFQPPSCGSNNGVNKNMACETKWAALNTSGFEAATGVTVPAANPWGMSIEVCNTSACGAQGASPPFTALLRTQTPWGGVIEQTVVEPLTAG
ncbi:hypothetical protein [Acidihalobacter ferrooxydans]|nr:hypothetical protein [Acidihalobacter ferrooxydans]